MHKALFGSVATLAFAVIGPPGGDPPTSCPATDLGPEPSLVWKGIKSGPGPIYPAGPEEQRPAPSLASPAPDRDPRPPDPFRIGPPYPR